MSAQRRPSPTVVTAAAPYPSGAWLNRHVPLDLTGSCVTMAQYPGGQLIYRSAGQAMPGNAIHVTESGSVTARRASGALQASPAAIPAMDLPDYYPSLMMTEIGTGNQLNTFPFHVTRILRDWLCQNLQHPYATAEEKEQLQQMTGLSLHQINYWLTNARRRLVPRILYYINQARAKRGEGPITKSRCKNKCKWMTQRRRDHGSQHGHAHSSFAAIQAPPTTVGALGAACPAESTVAAGVPYSPPMSPEQSVDLHPGQYRPGKQPTSLPIASPMAVTMPPPHLPASQVILTSPAGPPQVISPSAGSPPMVFSRGGAQLVFLPGYARYAPSLPCAFSPNVHVPFASAVSPQCSAHRPLSRTSEPPPLEKIDA